jgi:hypothetical protein
MQFFGMGFFAPEMSDQALACLEMMADFEGKDEVIQRITENGLMYDRMMMMQEQMLKMAQVIDGTQGTDIANQMMAEEAGGEPPPGGAPMPEGEPDPGGAQAKMANTMERARVDMGS